MAATAKKRIGEMLLDAGIIDETQLKAALGHQRQWGVRLGQALVDLKLATEADIVRALSLKFGFEVAKLDALEPYGHEQALKLFPREFTVRNNVFPMWADTANVTVAMSDPTNLSVVDEIRFRTGRRVKVCIGGDREIAEAVKRFYPGEQDVQAIPLDIGAENAIVGEAVFDPFGGGSKDALEAFFGGDNPAIQPLEPMPAPGQAAPPAPAAVAVAAPPRPAAPRTTGSFPARPATSAGLPAQAAAPAAAPRAPAAPRPAGVPAQPGPRPATSAGVPAQAAAPAAPARPQGPGPRPTGSLPVQPAGRPATSAGLPAQPAAPARPAPAAPAPSPAASRPAAPAAARPAPVAGEARARRVELELEEPSGEVRLQDIAEGADVLTPLDEVPPQLLAAGQAEASAATEAAASRALSQKELAILESLDRLAGGAPAEPDIVKPAQAMAALIRLMIRRRIITEQEFLDELSKK